MFQPFNKLLFNLAFLPSWQPLTSAKKADALTVSSDGRMIMMLRGKVAYGLVEPREECPIGVEWMQVLGGCQVHQVVFRQSDAWFLTSQGVGGCF